jgi:hypothetical protein
LDVVDDNGDNIEHLESDNVETGGAAAPGAENGMVNGAGFFHVYSKSVLWT